MSSSSLPPTALTSLRLSWGSLSHRILCQHQSHPTLASEYPILFHTSSWSSAGTPALPLNHRRVLVSLLKMAQLWIVWLPPPNCVWPSANPAHSFLAIGLISAFAPPWSLRHLCSKGHATVCSPFLSWGTRAFLCLHYQTIKPSGQGLITC